MISRNAGNDNRRARRNNSTPGSENFPSAKEKKRERVRERERERKRKEPGTLVDVYLCSFRSRAQFRFVRFRGVLTSDEISRPPEGFFCPKDRASWEGWLGSGSVVRVSGARDTRPVRADCQSNSRRLNGNALANRFIERGTIGSRCS